MATHALTLRGLTLRRKPDEDVFERALAGDDVAFSEIYRRYHPRVYGFCLARSLDPATAADAAQDVFVQMLKADPGSVRSPKAWLFTVARNVVTDRHRQHGGSASAVPIAGDSSAWNALPVEADAADEAVSRETARDVYLALRRMRPRYRTALVMREIHGETSSAMADALETTPGAIDTLVSRARDSFGRIYAEVAGFPAQCRTAVELAYRRTGSGIDEADQTILDAHLADCPGCRLEAARAEQPAGLAALLPFLIASKPGGRSLIARAMSSFGGTPAQIGLSTVSANAQQWSTIAKAGAVALALGLAVVVPPLAFRQAGLLGRTSSASAVPLISARTIDGRAAAGSSRIGGLTGRTFGRIGVLTNVRSAQASAHDALCSSIAQLRSGHDSSLPCVEPLSSSDHTASDHIGSAGGTPSDSHASHSDSHPSSHSSGSTPVSHSTGGDSSGSHASTGGGSSHTDSHPGSDMGGSHSGN